MSSRPRRVSACSTRFRPGFFRLPACQKPSPPCRRRFAVDASAIITSIASRESGRFCAPLRRAACRTTRKPCCSATAGAISAVTPGCFPRRKDMVRFAQALLSGELIRRETLCRNRRKPNRFFARRRHLSSISGVSLFCQASAATTQRSAALDGHALHRPERLHGESSFHRSGCGTFCAVSRQPMPRARFTHRSTRRDGFDCLRFECARRRTYQMERWGAWFHPPRNMCISKTKCCMRRLKAACTRWGGCKLKNAVFPRPASEKDGRFSSLIRFKRFSL